ncbi:MAG: AMP-binding protein [Chloroflexi bacterium]|nr:AMP-binding protein [Chloroflexota bacterium]
MKPFLNPKAAESSFWNQYYETLPREKLNALHLVRLKKVLRHAYDHSPFYRRKLDEAGVRPEDIRSLDDFKRKVPLTDKSEFLPFQDEHPHYGVTGALPEEYLAMHYETSGTTGSPLRVPFTLYDFERFGESWVYGFWGLGMRPQDSFYFAFQFGLFVGFWSASQGVRRLGAKLYHGGGQTTEGHIRLMQRLRPTVLVCTPTYALRLAETAQSMGVEPASIGLKYTYHAGEPGPFALPALKKKLDEAWGATSGELLGMAEVDSMAPGCPLREGVHLNETNVFSWIRDPETGQEVGDGQMGENIVTSYVNNAQPLINYRTHDLVERHYRCDCGRTWAYFRGVVLGRTDFMVTVRGTNVYQSAVEKVLGSIPGVSHHYQLVLSTVREMDEMAVKVEPEPDVPSAKYPELARLVEEGLRATLKVRLEPQIVPPGALPRYELKTRRIIDERPPERRRLLER